MVTVVGVESYDGSLIIESDDDSIMWVNCSIILHYNVQFMAIETNESGVNIHNTCNIMTYYF